MLQKITINCYIDNNGINVLRKLKNKTLKRIYADICPVSNRFDSDLVSNLCFEANNSYLYRIKNELTDIRYGDDEYNVFRIDQTAFEELSEKNESQKSDSHPKFDKLSRKKWNTWEISSDIHTIRIYRDSVEWEYDNKIFCVNADIAIEFLGNGFEFLCVMQDSIAETMSVYNKYDDVNECINNWWFTNKWGIKTENVTCLNRTVISV